MNKGMKFDAGKPRLELLPPRAIMEIGRVLAFGAEKYDDDNWKLVEPLFKRYMGATLRHVFDCIKDQNASQYSYDKDSGLLGLAHAICDLMFILETQLEEIENAKTNKEKGARKFIGFELGEGYLPDESRARSGPY